jgi:hypothetical protein
LLTSTVRYPTAAIRDAVIASGVEDGTVQTLDRLAGYLRGLR